MKYLKFLTFIFILFLTTNVFALGELNTSSYSQADSFNSSSRYDYSTDNYLGEQTNFSVGVLGNRYNGKSYYFQFNFHYTIQASKMYDVKFSSDSYDFTNQINSDRVVPLCYSSFAYNFNTKECNDISIVSVKRGSTSGGNSKEFTIRFVSGSNYTYWGFKIAGGLYNLTSVNNFKIGNISLNEVESSNTNDIINNQNQNTQEIINNSTSNSNNIIENNTQNTQDIINNQNQNTQDIINSQNENSERLNDNLSNCYTLTNKINIIPSVDYWENGDLSNANGGIKIPGDSYIRTKYFIKVESNVNYYFNYTGSFYYTIYKYDNSFNYLGRYDNTSFTSPRGFSFGSTTSYIKIALRNNPSSDSITTNVILTNKFQLEKSSSYTGYSSPSSNLNCQSKIDSTNEYLMDNSDPNISDSEFTNLFNSVGFNDPLSYLLQLPVQFINQLVSQSNTCQTISLGTLWGVSLSLPCINIGSIIGQQVWDIIDVLFSVGLLVVIFKNLYQTFANLMTMGGEKEAREKFSMPTPMEFLSLILGGDR